MKPAPSEAAPTVASIVRREIVAGRGSSGVLVPSS